MLAWLARPWQRRTFAAVVALAMLSFGFEPLIADVHDGDALTTAVEPSPHGEGMAAAHAADELRVSARHVESASWNDRVSDDASPAPAPAPAPGHSAHICHGAHDHLASAPEFFTGPAAVVVPARSTPSGYTFRLPSRALEPPFRPPIA